MEREARETCMRNFPTRSSGPIVNDPFTRTWAELDHWFSLQGTSLYAQCQQRLSEMLGTQGVTVLLRHALAEEQVAASHLRKVQQDIRHHLRTALDTGLKYWDLACACVPATGDPTTTALKRKRFRSAMACRLCEANKQKRQHQHDEAFSD